MDGLSRIGSGVVTRCRIRFCPLFYKWSLDSHKLWLDLGIRLQLGLGSLPLWPLGLCKPLWLDVDTWLRLGAILGQLETVQWSLWMGTHGLRSKHQHQFW